MQKLLSILLLFCLVFAGCRPLRTLFDPVSDETFVPYEPFYEIGSDLEPDPAIEAYLAPYRNRILAAMDDRLTQVDATFSNREIGYLAADMIRYRAAHESQSYVHLGLYDPDDVVVEVREGAVTRGDIHELIPYDKTLVILKLTGRQVTVLANEIAGRGDHVPVSGMRFTVVDRQARGLLVDGGVVSPDSTYALATTSTLAESGGGYTALQSIDEKIEYPVLIRQLVIDYLADQPSVEPLMDQRIRSL